MRPLGAGRDRACLDDMSEQAQVLEVEMKHGFAHREGWFRY
jgi:hypothetical protein